MKAYNKLLRFVVTFYHFSKFIWHNRMNSYFHFNKIGSIMMSSFEWQKIFPRKKSKDEELYDLYGFHQTCLTWFLDPLYHSTLIKITNHKDLSNLHLTSKTLTLSNLENKKSLNIFGIFCCSWNTFLLPSSFYYIWIVKHRTQCRTVIFR